MGISSRESKHSTARDGWIFLALCLTHLIQAFKLKPITRFGNREKLSSGRQGLWYMLPSLATCSLAAFTTYVFHPAWPRTPALSLSFPTFYLWHGTLIHIYVFLWWNTAAKTQGEKRDWGTGGDKCVAFLCGWRFRGCQQHCVGNSHCPTKLEHCWALRG